LGSRKRTINRIILAGTFLAFVIARSAVIKHFVTGDQQFQMISFEYIITAIVVLFLFLNLGLLYKSKLIQNQIIQMEIQKQSALNHQRMMISADLHDDMGASLSSIHLNAITAIKSLSDNIPQTEQILKRLVEDLKSVIENMGDIIWAINPDKQTFKPISAQLKDSYFDLMDDYNIQCNYNIDNKLEAQITNINARKNLILIAKEAINNILKHAKSSNIDISLHAEESNIVLKIQDNGIGIRDTENNFSGNGLRNMKFRTEKMNGTLTIKSEKEKGTIISCIVPIANIHYTNRENLD
jgi:signal transduction histidine kinase